MMALSFSCLIIPFFIFFVFPSLSCSCRSNPVFPPCGNVEVRFPFYTNYSDSNPTKNTASVSPNIPRENTTNPECRGHHLVVCHGSTPIILFNGHEPWYVLETIDYALSTITIQGQELSNKLNTPDCIFLYNFDPPIDLSGNLSLPHFVGQNQTFFNCMPGAYNFSADIFYKIYNRTPCKDYELHFSNRQEDKGLDHSECWNGASLFEWELSFGGVGDGLSLRSAKYLHQRTWRWACVEHSTRRDFKCLCDKGCQKNSHTGRTIGIGLTVGLGVFFLASLMFLRYLRKCKFLIWKKSNSAPDIEEFLKKYGSLAPKRYRYADIKKITKNFHDKLGQGDFGTLFKGSLDDGLLVAVKILSGSKGNGKEFVNEVASIGRTSHVNIVSLLGFCSEGSKRALIYEFMPNGSLEKYIYSEKLATLGLEKLYQIAIGIAQGLEYLHFRCNTRIVHFDIKPHNILLDKEFCPKISDFGLAKLSPAKVSILSMTDPRGTIGYMAPEVFSRNFGIVSSKSDVYSYGMMILEMVGGRKNVDAGVRNTSEVYFPHWIYECLDQDGDLHTSGVTSETKEIARKMILVGLWCIQIRSENRPLISKVVEMLQGSVDELQMPPKPYLFSPLESFVSSS